MSLCTWAIKTLNAEADKLYSALTIKSSNALGVLVKRRAEMFAMASKGRQRERAGFKIVWKSSQGDKIRRSKGIY